MLTDGPSFGGSPEDLAAARAACPLPVLRKDFTVSANDVLDARLMGADCVLLIAAALDDAELAEFRALATEVGLDALVEVHDEPELERALTAGATLVGVNQRDLVTFEVDHARAARMASVFPDSVLSVAESGVRGPEDAADLGGRGLRRRAGGRVARDIGRPRPGRRRPPRRRPLTPASGTTSFGPRPSIVGPERWGRGFWHHVVRSSTTDRGTRTDGGGFWRPVDGGETRFWDHVVRSSTVNRGTRTDGGAETGMR